MNLKKITTLVSLFGLVVLLIGFSACERVSEVVQPTAPQPVETEEEITIGVVLSLTGGFTESFKRPILQGFELARHEINAVQPKGLKLKFIIEDDQSTVEGAVAAFNKLIHQEGVSVILGPATSGQTEAAFRVAAENRVVAISPTSAARGLSGMSDYVFRVSLTTDMLIPSGIKITHANLGYQRVATMYEETDLFSTDGNIAVREALTATGVEILLTETFQADTDDFSEQLSRVAAVNPDAVFVAALPANRVKILAQKHQIGLSVPFFVRSLTGIDISSLGAAAEGAISFVGWSNADVLPSNQAFVRRYRVEYGMEPNNYAASAYATLYILEDALANAGSTDPAAVRDALADIRDFDTIFGKFSFDVHGDAVYSPKVLIVQDGEFKPFK